VLTTKIRQTILHSITDIMAAAAVDVMDMEKEKDKDRVEDSISRILSVRRRRCRESKVAACSPEFAAGTAASTPNTSHRNQHPRRARYPDKKRLREWRSLNCGLFSTFHHRIKIN